MGGMLSDEVLNKLKSTSYNEEVVSWLEKKVKERKEGSLWEKVKRYGRG